MHDICIQYIMLENNVTVMLFKPLHVVYSVLFRSRGYCTSKSKSILSLYSMLPWQPLFEPHFSWVQRVAMVTLYISEAPHYIYIVLR